MNANVGPCQQINLRGWYVKVICQSCAYSLLQPALKWPTKRKSVNAPLGKNRIPGAVEPCR